MKEIETAAKVAGGEDVSPTHVPEPAKELPTLQPRVSSAASSRPGSASSNQGFRAQSVGLPPPAGPAASSITTPAPTVSVNPPTKNPPTAPRGFQSQQQPRPWGRGRGIGYARGGNYTPTVKREHTDEENNNIISGYRRGTSRGIDRGARRGGMIGRGGMNGERAPAREVPLDSEMLDAKTREDKAQPEKEEGRLDVEMADAPKAPEKEATPEKPPTPIIAPVVKPEDKMDEDHLDGEEDDVELTQQDVMAKISDIDRDVERLEQQLLDLAARKADHLVAVEKEEQLEREQVALAAARPATLVDDEPADEDMCTIKEEQTVVMTPSMSPIMSTPLHSASSGSPASPSSSEGGSTETESDESLKAFKDSPRDLPYFQPGPPAKPSELEFFRSNLAETEIRELIITEISTHKKEVFEKGNQLKRKYKELYGEWSQKSHDLDRERESTRKKKGVSEPTDTGISPLVTVTPASETVTRRRGGNVPVGDVVRSEAEMEQVMKDLMEQDEAADARAKLDGPKEAEVPDMILDEREKLLFRDTNRLLRTEEEILKAFRYEIPPDDFTTEEHQKFCELYLQFPKLWHKIAAGMENRDFKACIQHYYMTKKVVNYKELLNKGKRSRRKRGRAAAPAKTRQSALLADLGKGKGAGGGNGEEEDADTEDVTPAPAVNERGRPKRAAAPTFGQDSNKDKDNFKDDNDTPASSGGRRGANKESKGDDDGTEKEKTTGTKRTRGGNNGGRERGNKRVRTPATAATTPAPSVPSTPSAQPLLAPISEKKPAKVKEDLVQRESDAVTALAGLSSGAENIAASTSNIVICTPEVQPQPQARAATSTPKKDKEKADRSVGAATSSYWSVPEQNDFPQLLAVYGTNWGQISQCLASKTTVMVIHIPS